MLGWDSASRLGFNFCCCGGWVGFVLGFLFVCLFIGVGFFLLHFSCFCLFLVSFLPRGTPISASHWGSPGPAPTPPHHQKPGPNPPSPWG